MSEPVPKHKVEFCCMDPKCMEQGKGGCVLSFWVENGPDNTDTPNYCPYELDPQEHKFVPWRRLK